VIQVGCGSESVLDEQDYEHRTGAYNKCASSQVRTPKQDVVSYGKSEIIVRILWHWVHNTETRRGCGLH
jgi:hypothetical protein